ncbi:uncharacterized protein LOC144173588 [Haemaphysalis longicornis]
MSFSSPGQGTTSWSASLSAQDVPLDSFLRNGVTAVLVALVPTNGGAIRLKNFKTIQKDLQAVSEHYKNVKEVRPYGKGGIICKSSDNACLAGLLTCTNFGSFPVSPFVPSHFACSKGIVRGVDVDISPSELLDQFLDAGVVAVYRCSRVVDSTRIPTESVIATFAGTACPSEIKVWPLVYRVDPLSPHPRQCRNCWRFGHNTGSCKSSTRCGNCGGEHLASQCTAVESSCSLCGSAHPADYSNCPARASEINVLEVLEKRRCSRKEAMAIVKERTYGYAGAVARQTPSNEQSLAKAICTAFKEVLPEISGQLALSVTEQVSNLLSAHTQQLAQVLSLPLSAFQ